MLENLKRKNMSKGSINVTAQNIFPIIKKFLYSDHEIFLRELVSNAVDATQKLKTLTNLGEAKGELGDLTIHINVDKKAKTLSIIDRGIGMTAEEIDKYIKKREKAGPTQARAAPVTQPRTQTPSPFLHPMRPRDPTPTDIDRRGQ